MDMRININKLVEQMEMMCEEQIYLFNRKTYKFHNIDPDYYRIVLDGEDEERWDDFKPWEKEVIEEIRDFFENEEDYITIPSKMTLMNTD